MTFSAADHAAMARALQLAARGLHTTTPNPRVGCVLTTADGRVIGEGWHARAGAPHAEIVALQAAGDAARGATAYVTLEPCSHFGRTPPCADALVAAGVARVVAAMEDPNPLVRGRGLEHLRANGIATATGLLSDQAQELNIGFIARMTCGRPWLRLKAAATLDGRTALANGVSKWITGAPARRDGHGWRARACAVLTGIGTVRDDDPRLDVREVACSRQPLRVLVDSRLEVAPTARILDGGNCLIASTTDNPGRRAALEARGAEIVVLPACADGVDLAALLGELARRGCNEVHAEAGFRLNGALMRAALVDELLLYLAPMLAGGHARGLFDLAAMQSLAEAPRLQLHDVRMLGGDIRVLARLQGS